MKQTLMVIITTLITTLSTSAQEISISTQNFKLKQINTLETPTTSRGRLSDFPIDQRRIYIGALMLFKHKVSSPKDDEDEFSYTTILAKYFIGYNTNKFLITGNYDYNPDSNEEKRIYGEILYPVLGGFNKVFAVSLSAGAGVNILAEGSKYNYKLGQYDHSINETSLYVPMGAYVDYLNPMGGGTYGLRIGFCVSFNPSDYRKYAFTQEGFMAGAFFRF